MAILVNRTPHTEMRSIEVSDVVESKRTSDIYLVIKDERKVMLQQFTGVRLTDSEAPGGYFETSILEREDFELFKGSVTFRNL